MMMASEMIRNRNLILNPNLSLNLNLNLMCEHHLSMWAILFSTLMLSFIADCGATEHSNHHSYTSTFSPANYHGIAHHHRGEKLDRTIALSINPSDHNNPNGSRSHSEDHGASLPAIANPSIITYETMFFTQQLDHFSFAPESYGTFQQRYLLNDRYWGGAGLRSPIFVYCGNEGDIEWFANNTGFLWEIAPTYQALVVFPEHRYYGGSIPGIAMEERTNETLGYLTSEQALADYATLILDLKKNLSAEDCPVVVFGGSYGGMLAAWFRLKYPHIAIGALAASAPILEFDNLVPWDGFFRIVSENFKNESMSCFETIKGSWDALSHAYDEDGGIERVSKLFNFCNNNMVDLSSVENFLYSAWIYMAMTNYPYEANFLEPMPANPVKVACEAIDSFPEGTDVLTRVVAGANVYYNGSGQVQQCFNMSNSDPHGLALWSWQACTEMVMPLSSNPENSMFPASNYSYKSAGEECIQEFGVSPRPHWISQEFGGNDIRSVLKHFASNIIFSNGLLDPWSNGGVLENISKTVVALVTPKGAHHLDLRASTSQDPHWLRKQRNEEKKHISRWLRQYYADFNFSSS